MQLESQYFEPSQDAVAQADLLLKRIGGKLEAGDLPPTIDVEVKGTTGAMVKAWLNRVEAALGVKPMIYTGYYFWRDTMGDPQGFGAYPLWIAGYVTCPSITDQWSKWTFWQYSDSNGTLDVDKFNGTLAELLAFAHGQPDYAATFVKQSHPYASQPPVQLTVGETVKGSITFKNVGKQSWKAGVTKLAPIPRDKTSQLHASSWLSTTRVSTVPSDVAPGSEGTFEWDLSGNAVGDFDQFFGLVQEGVTWFADAPQGGGPSDNNIEVKAHVSQSTQVDAGVDAGVDANDADSNLDSGAEDSNTTVDDSASNDAPAADVSPSETGADAHNDATGSIVTAAPVGESGSCQLGAKAPRFSSLASLLAIATAMALRLRSRTTATVSR